MPVPFDCPRCGVVLTMSERSGVEIDYWPQCRGVLLDRGELDKIIERVEADSPRHHNSPSRLRPQLPPLGPPRPSRPPAGRRPRRWPTATGMGRAVTGDTAATGGASRG